MPKITMTAGFLATLFTAGGAFVVVPVVPEALVAEAPRQALSHLAVARLAAHAPASLRSAWLDSPAPASPDAGLADRQQVEARRFARDYAVAPAIWTAPLTRARGVEF